MVTPVKHETNQHKPFSLADKLDIGLIQLSSDAGNRLSEKVDGLYATSDLPAGTVTGQVLVWNGTTNKWETASGDCLLELVTTSSNFTAGANDNGKTVVFTSPVSANLGGLPIGGRVNVLNNSNGDVSVHGKSVPPGGAATGVKIDGSTVFVIGGV